ncbi:Arf-GAP with Rho-GAP domain, ANK repeat and PH domain-containing protein 3 [Liparis tanakae]|uniref:Arf-GAP with Rho-GAP domain, ANK repeat and PH domain-containing protein 3 n=1 Tax=Liparis tanakae TaxID=230148 RepID=A0A4Z2H882_9TELE|nr:Arf-GAP with Rho-GAP domain, ANK repeat and PH domain-containing protein 3 [Liparis tanakae]
MWVVMASLDGNTTVETLLVAIHLERYLDTFHRAGLLLARDFTHLDHDAFVSLGITATGHRKRILRLLNNVQRMESQRANQNAHLPRDRCQSVTDVSSPERGRGAASLCRPPGPGTFEAFRNSSAPNLRAMLSSSEAGRPAAKPVPKPRTVFNRRRTAPIHFCPTPDSAPTPSRRLSQESICFSVLDDLTSGDTPTSDDGLTSVLGSTSQRPAAPDDPEEEISPYCETLFISRRNPHPCENESSRVEDRHAEDPGMQKFSWTRRWSQALHSGDAQGYSTVGEPPPASRYLSLPPHTFSSEADEDLLISPYASYTSLTERAPPVISSWLDKLSPQGNYVFQKRFVKFDGRNLMYFGSEKLAFGRRRFGPGSHCQRHGVLELKGTKSRVYAAIHTDQVWVYKSEQCFRSGVGITVIEARGSTIRDGKHKSFELITPHRSFSLCSAPSFTAASDRAKRAWMEALQEAIAETLSDYEVAEKIWSNRSNRSCADCRAPDPDWASINLYPSVYDEIMQPVLHSGFLYKASSVHRGTLSRKTRADFQRFWCSVDRSRLLCGSDRSAEPSLQISIQDIVCLGVSRPEAPGGNGFIDRFLYTFELYLTSEKLHQFGLETADALQGWTGSIGKAATPLSCHCLLTREFERVGLLRYRAMLDPRRWREAFFVLQKSNLFICPRTDGAAEDIINLNRLQELSLTSDTEDQEKKDVLVLVEKGRTLHLRGVGRTDFSLWYSDIQRAAGGKGNALREQQLSRNDIPIIVDSCLAFITQYGLGHEGIYRKNGAKSRIRLLMEEFRKDARNVKLRIGDHFIEDVTDVLKRFFREVDDPIFMADLHPLWQGAAELPQRSQRLDRYKEIIRSLPRVNRTTLGALISHLYRVQKCADLNQMCTKNLSLLFAPSLFQTDGKGVHEVKIVEDLIDNYLEVFDIDEEHQTQIELEISLITTWKDTQLSQAGDLIIEVYLEMKIPDCCVTLKVSPTMCAEELTNQVLFMRNVPAGDKDVWMTFEAIEDGQLAYHSETMKIGLLRCREEPPKLLQGNRFQERTFQILQHKLLLLKDKKSIKPEKEWSLKAMKVYVGIRRKLKAPSRYRGH